MYTIEEDGSSIECGYEMYDEAGNAETIYDVYFAFGPSYIGFLPASLFIGSSESEFCVISVYEIYNDRYVPFLPVIGKELNYSNPYASFGGKDKILYYDNSIAGSSTGNSNSSAGKVAPGFGIGALEELDDEDVDVYTGLLFDNVVPYYI